MERKITPRLPNDPAAAPLLRVAGYARVSGGKDEQLESLSAQVSHYSELIQNHPGWAYAGVFIDEAYTGTKDARPGFQQMMEACRAGKIDLLLVKSLSRLARNTVTMLQYTRELTDLGVDVYFERENIHSNSGDGELLLTILAAYAQEESLSASENTKWRIRNQFKEGMVHGRALLGYKQERGRLVPVPEEAEIVRTIFAEYLSGLGMLAIAKKLNAAGMPTRFGAAWHPNSVAHILSNTTYMGDLWLQKTFTVDHLGKKQRVNQGELTKYLVQDKHEPIIDPETFRMVQQERERRAGRHHPSKEAPSRYPFTGLITCGYCGKHYRRKIANAGSPYEKPVWICGTFNTKGKAACPSRQIPESILMATCAEALGAHSFHEPDFLCRVKGITAMDGNRLLFEMTDGGQIERTWQHKSRSDAWDDNNRQRARERKLAGLRRNAHEPSSDQ